MILIGSLALLAVVVWGRVFGGGSDTADAVKCAPPTGSDKPVGQVLPPNGLDDVEPIAPASIKLTVFNGGDMRGRANLAAEELMSLGFNKANDPDNDPLYPEHDLNCHGQIRFGQGGAAAARTLSVVVPCAELVRDDRQDATIDLAVGHKFEEIRPNGKAKHVLDALTKPPGVEVSPELAAAAAEDLSPEAIAKARQTRC